jgi:hypothetical protein
MVLQAVAVAVAVQVVDNHRAKAKVMAVLVVQAEDLVVQVAVLVVQVVHQLQPLNQALVQVAVAVKDGQPLEALATIHLPT